MKHSSIAIVTVPRGKRVAMSSPVIARIDGTHFSILWRGKPPLEWAVQSQGDEGGEWDINTVVAGNLTVVLLTSAPYAVRIVGRDADRNPVTEVSNVLVLNAAPPAPSITSPSADIEADTPQGHAADGPPESNWQLFQSLTGTGDPDTDPSEWETGGSAGGSFTGTHAAWSGTDYSHWYIAAYVENGIRSRWSNKAQAR